MIGLALGLWTGCTGQLVQALEARQARSCIWFTGPFARGVTATGGVDVQTCLAQRHTWP